MKYSYNSMTITILSECWMVIITEDIKLTWTCAADSRKATLTAFLVQCSNLLRPHISTQILLLTKVSWNLTSMHTPVLNRIHSRKNTITTNLFMSITGVPEHWQLRKRYCNIFVLPISLEHMHFKTLPMTLINIPFSDLCLQGNVNHCN